MVAHHQRLNRGISRAHSRAVGGTIRLEEIQALSSRDDALGVFSNYVVSTKLPAEKDRPISAEIMVAASQTTFYDDF